MNVTISSKTTSVDDAMREEIRAQVYFALSRYSPRVDQVAVRIGHVGGMRGDGRQLCRLSVRIKPLGSFLVECVEDDLAAAVTRAAERAARRLERFLDGERGQLRRA
jgi:ribosome-associated translation inhibitor RaiA